jgi:hypothetical protein
MLSSGSQKIQLESGLPSKPHYPPFQKDLPNSGTGQCQILDWLLAKRRNRQGRRPENPRKDGPQTQALQKNEFVNLMPRLGKRSRKYMHLTKSPSLGVASQSGRITRCATGQGGCAKSWSCGGPRDQGYYKRT